MYNSKDEKCFDENDLSSIVASSLRNVIENSVIDVVAPYRILSIAHISSWKTFQNDLIQILKQNSNLNPKNNQDFILLNHFDCYKNHFNNDKHREEDIYFESLMNSHIDFIPIKSNSDRLRPFI